MIGGPDLTWRNSMQLHQKYLRSYKNIWTVLVFCCDTMIPPFSGPVHIVKEKAEASCS